MGIRVGNINNIKLVKRSSGVVVAGTAVPAHIQTSSVEEATPVLLLKRQIKKLLQTEQTLLIPERPRGRVEWLGHLEKVLEGNIFPLEMWADGKITVQLKPGKIYRWSDDVQLRFYCWEKGRKNSTWLEGVADCSTNYQKYSSAGYPMTLKFTELAPLPQATKVILKNAKANAVIAPKKLLPSVEAQQLQDLEKRIIAKPEAMVNQYYSVWDYWSSANHTLLQYLGNNIFNEPISSDLTKTNYIGRDTNGDYRFSFYRTYQKKATLREAVVKYIMPPAGQRSGSFQIVDIKKI